jgi:hypothetical protein
VKKPMASAPAPDVLESAIGSRPPAPAAVPIPDMVITSKTREEITGIISKVKSVTPTAPEVSPEELKAIRENQIQKLEDSGVVEALAGNLVSKVDTDTTAQGKFSKMTLEASLIFDDEELKSKGK